MKKFLFIAVLLFTISKSFAHFIWIETNGTGKLNQKHHIKIRFGELAKNVIEKTNEESFKNVNKFKVWLIAPNGKREELSTIAKENYYAASFLPNQNGTYTIALDNKNIKVFDFTKYDYTIFKPNYHAKANVTVGYDSKNTIQTNTKGIEIINNTTKEDSRNNITKLQVLFKGKPLSNSEVSLISKNKKTKTVITDNKGFFTIKSTNKPEVIEATYEEKTPGTFNDVAYKLIWQCATYSFI